MFWGCPCIGMTELLKLVHTQWRLTISRLLCGKRRNDAVNSRTPPPLSGMPYISFSRAHFVHPELFKSAPHISPGALCAACDPMAIQPGSGLPAKGIAFVHEALACQPGPFPLWNIPDHSQDPLKSMQKLIKYMDSSILLATP